MKQFNNNSLEESPSGFTAVFLALAIGAVSGLLTFFSTGSGDHDAYMMAAGVAHGINTGHVINPMNYGNHAQFMFYYTANFLGRILHPDSASILLAMNAVGTALAVITPALLYLLIKRNFAINSAHLVPVLIITNSAYLFSLPLGHPFQYALAICIISLILFFEGLRKEGGSGWALLAASAVFQGLALTIRTEQIFLFWFCILALLIYSRDYDRKKWARIFGLFAFSFIFYYILHKALVPNIPGVTYEPGAAERFSSVVQRYTDLIYKTYSPASLKWSLPYHLTELGVPLILMTFYFACRAMIEKRFADLFALAVSAGPSFLIYLGNPIPPRHFLITAAALSIFVGASIRIKKNSALVAAGVAVLLINISFPPFLNIIEPATETRRNHTYNFYQKLERNKEEINSVLPVIKGIATKAPGGTVVLGKWVHISQFIMAASDFDGVSLHRTILSLGGNASVNAFEIRFGQRSVYLVETYKAQDALRLAARLKESNPDFRFMSFLKDKNRPLNDLNMIIPDEASYWSS